MNGRFGTTVLSEVRNALGDEIESNDTVRWTVTDGKITVGVGSE